MGIQNPDPRQGRNEKNATEKKIIKTIIIFSVVDPDPNWIRIQDLCGSGSVISSNAIIFKVKKFKKKIAFLLNYFKFFLSKFIK